MKRRRRNIVAIVFLVVFFALGAFEIIFPVHAVAAEPVPAVPVPAEPVPKKPVSQMDDCFARGNDSGIQSAVEGVYRNWEIS